MPLESSETDGLRVRIDSRGGPAGLSSWFHPSHTAPRCPPSKSLWRKERRVVAPRQVIGGSVLVMRGLGHGKLQSSLQGKEKQSAAHKGFLLHVLYTLHLINTFCVCSTLRAYTDPQRRLVSICWKHVVLQMKMRALEGSLCHCHARALSCL